MIAQCFADTNLFLYAGSKDPADKLKKKIARELIASEDIGISAQVLQEFIAAHELHCKVIYSEDLNDGQDYGGVVVHNPFA